MKTANDNQIVENRIADEAIYNNLDYYDEPKEYFDLALREIMTELGAPTSLLDVGCANGAFLHHARRRFPQCELKGLEPLKLLAELTTLNVPGVRVFQGGLLDEAAQDSLGCSSIVSMLGVLGIFFDPALVVKHLLNLTIPGGRIVIVSPFNEEPIDVILNYRRAPDGAWESGHNLFSTETIERVCAGFGAKCRWADFRISKEIPKTDDPMRSWTEPFRGDKHHIVYGTNMFATMKVLVIRKP
jgi:SAM-dependent methyltransferase